jgi:cobalt-zinc-cadmium efflux system outer membrane protein
MKIREKHIVDQNYTTVTDDMNFLDLRSFLLITANTMRFTFGCQRILFFLSGRAALLAIALQAMPAAAAETYTLERLVALAREHNASLLASRDAAAAARAGIVSAGAFPNPEVEYLSGKQRARAPSASVGEAKSFWFTQRLEYPHQRNARIDAARAGAEMADGEARSIEANVLSLLRVRFYDLLRREAEVKAAEEDLALMEQIHKRVAVRVETGEAPRYELIKAEAETLNSRKVSQSSKLRVVQARTALRLVVGGRLPEEFSVSGDLDRPREVLPLEILRREVEERNPELFRARAATQQALQQMELERSLRLPAVSLRAGYDQDPDVRAQQFGVVVTVPLFDRRTGPLAAAAAQYSRTQHDRDYQRLALLQSLEAAWQQFQIAQGQVSALESGIVRQAESALKVAEAAYRYGERGILDYLDAQRVYRSVRNELIAARHDLQLAAIEIERLRAIPDNSNP